MNNYKNRHKKWIKTITMVVVCLFAFNTISWAYSPSSSNYPRNTLQVQSVFRPIVEAANLKDNLQVRFEIAIIAKMISENKETPCQNINAALNQWYYNIQNSRTNPFFGEHKILKITSGKPILENDHVYVEAVVAKGVYSGRKFKISSSNGFYDQKDIIPDIQKDEAKIKIEPIHGNDGKKHSDWSENQVKNNDNHVQLNIRGIATLAGLLIGAYFQIPAIGFLVGLFIDVGYHVTYKTIKNKKPVFFARTSYPKHIAQLVKTANFERLKNIIEKDKDAKNTLHALHALIDIALMRNYREKGIDYDNIFEARHILPRLAEKDIEIARKILARTMEMMRKTPISDSYYPHELLEVLIHAIQYQSELIKEVIATFTKTLKRKGLAEIEYLNAFYVLSELARHSKFFGREISKFVTTSLLNLIVETILIKGKSSTFYSKIAEKIKEIASGKITVLGSGLYNKEKTNSAKSISLIILSFLAQKNISPAISTDLMDILHDIYMKDNDIIDEDGTHILIQRALTKTGLPEEYYSSASRILRSLIKHEAQASLRIIRDVQNIAIERKLDAKAIKSLASIFYAALSDYPEYLTLETIEACNIMLQRKDLEQNTYQYLVISLFNIASQKPEFINKVKNVLKTVVQDKETRKSIVYWIIENILDIRSEDESSIRFMLEILLDIFTNENIDIGKSDLMRLMGGEEKDSSVFSGSYLSRRRSGIIEKLDHVIENHPGLVDTLFIDLLFGMIKKMPKDDEYRHSILLENIKKLYKQRSDLREHIVALLKDMLFNPKLTDNTFKGFLAFLNNIIEDNSSEAGGYIKTLKEILIREDTPEFHRTLVKDCLVEVSEKNEKIAEKVIGVGSEIIKTSLLSENVYKEAGLLMLELSANLPSRERIVQSLQSVILSKGLREINYTAAINTLNKIADKEPDFDKENAKFNKTAFYMNDLDPLAKNVIRKNIARFFFRMHEYMENPVIIAELILEEHDLESWMYERISKGVVRIIKKSPESITKKTVLALQETLMRNELEGSAYTAARDTLKEIVNNRTDLAEDVYSSSKLVLLKAGLNKAAYECASVCISLIAEKVPDKRLEILYFFVYILKNHEMDLSVRSLGISGITSILEIDPDIVDDSMIALIEETAKVGSNDIYEKFLTTIVAILSKEKRKLITASTIEILEKILNTPGFSMKDYGKALYCLNEIIGVDYDLIEDSTIKSVVNFLKREEYGWYDIKYKYKYSKAPSDLFETLYKRRKKFSKPIMRELENCLKEKGLNESAYLNALDCINYMLITERDLAQKSTIKAIEQILNFGFESSLPHNKAIEVIGKIIGTQPDLIESSTLKALENLTKLKHGEGINWEGITRNINVIIEKKPELASHSTCKTLGQILTNKEFIVAGSWNAYFAAARGLVKIAETNEKLARLVRNFLKYAFQLKGVDNSALLQIARAISLSDEVKSEIGRQVYTYLKTTIIKKDLGDSSYGIAYDALSSIANKNPDLISGVIIKAIESIANNPEAGYTPNALDCLASIIENKPELLTPSTAQVLDGVLLKTGLDEKAYIKFYRCCEVLAEKKSSMVNEKMLKMAENDLRTVGKDEEKEKVSDEQHKAALQFIESIISNIPSLLTKETTLSLQKFLMEHGDYSWRFEDSTEKSIACLNALAEQRPELVKPSLFGMEEDNLGDVWRNDGGEKLFKHYVLAEDENAKKALAILEKIISKLENAFDMFNPGKLIEVVITERPDLIGTTTIEALKKRAEIMSTRSSSDSHHFKDRFKTMIKIAQTRSDLSKKVFKSFIEITKEKGENDNRYYIYPGIIDACKEFDAKERPQIDAFFEYLATVIKGEVAVERSYEREDIYAQYSGIFVEVAEKNEFLRPEAISRLKELLLEGEYNEMAEVYIGYALAHIATKQRDSAEDILGFLENTLKQKNLPETVYHSVSIALFAIAERNQEDELGKKAVGLIEKLFKTSELDEKVYQVLGKSFNNHIEKRFHGDSWESLTSHEDLLQPSMVKAIESVLKRKGLSSATYQLAIFGLTEVLKAKPELITQSAVNIVTRLVGRDDLKHQFYSFAAACISVVVSENKDSGSEKFIKKNTVKALEKVLNRCEQGISWQNAYSEVVEALRRITEKRPELISQNTVESVAKVIDPEEVDPNDKKKIYYSYSRGNSFLPEISKFFDRVLEHREDLNITNNTLGGLRKILNKVYIEREQYKESNVDEYRANRVVKSIIYTFNRFFTKNTETIDLQVIEALERVFLSKLPTNDHFSGFSSSYCLLARTFELIGRESPIHAERAISTLETKLKSKEMNEKVYRDVAMALLNIAVNNGKLAQRSIKALQECSLLHEGGSPAAEGISRALEGNISKHDKVLENISGPAKLFFIWFLKGLWLLKDIMEEYLNSEDPDAFLDRLIYRVRNLQKEGLDLNSEEGLRLGYLSLKFYGLKAEEITFTDYAGRIAEIRKFDKKHPGYMENLFKENTYPLINLKSKAGELDVEDVDTSVFDEHIRILENEIRSLDDFSLLEEALGNKYKKFTQRLYAYIQIQLMMKDDEKLREKIGNLNTKKLDWHMKKSEGQKLIKENKLIEELKKLAGENSKLFYQGIFLLLWNSSNQLADKKTAAPYARILRAVITANRVKSFPDSFNKIKENEDTAERVREFSNFYTDIHYKDQIPLALGMPSVLDTRALVLEYENFTSEVFAEIDKAKIDKEGNAATGYRLVPVVGFIALFRGRAGVTDCSYELDDPEDFRHGRFGNAFTRAMHEDTNYYYLYKGNELKGYIGLLEGADEKGRKILTIDTFQSASFGSKEIIMESLKKIADIAKEKGFSAIALPSNLDPPFNFPDVIDLIAELKVYKESPSVVVTPIHKESWDFFYLMFGRDIGNSIDQHGPYFHVIEFDKLEEEAQEEAPETPQEEPETVPVLEEASTRTLENEIEDSCKISSSLMSAIEQGVSSSPIDIEIDLSLIDRESMEEYAETWAYLIYSCYKNKDINFIFTSPKYEDVENLPEELFNAMRDSITYDEFEAALKRQLKAKALLYTEDGDIQKLLTERIGFKPRDNVARISIYPKARLDYMHKSGIDLEENQYPIALDGITSIKDEGTALRNFEAALALGLCKIALLNAKKKDEEAKASEELPKLKERILQKMKDIYKLYIKDPDFNIDEETLDHMISDSSNVKLELAIYHALPPIIRLPIKELQEYHQKLNLFIQNA